MGYAIGLAVASGLTNEEKARELPILVSDYIAAEIEVNDKRFGKSVQRTRTRLHFVESRSSQASSNATRLI